MAADRTDEILERAEAGPPGAGSRAGFAEFPWWLIIVGGLIGLILLAVITLPAWNEAFDAIVLGMGMTLFTTAVSFVFATVLGLMFALARLSRFTLLRQAAMTYIEVIRGVPVLVTIFVVAFVLFRSIGDFRIPMVARGIIALSLIYAAFIAEVFRAGIESVPRGQVEAGMSMGLSQRQVLRFVVMPQAIRNIMPALGNDLIALLKDSSLLSILAIRELTQWTRLWTGRTFQFRAGFFVLTMFYLLLTIGLSLLLRWYEKRIRIPSS